MTMQVANYRTSGIAAFERLKEAEWGMKGMPKPCAKLNQQIAWYWQMVGISPCDECPLVGRCSVPNAEGHYIACQAFYRYVNGMDWENTPRKPDTKTYMNIYRDPSKNPLVRD